jgi:hypothetical protein
MSLESIYVGRFLYKSWEENKVPRFSPTLGAFGEVAFSVPGEDENHAVTTIDVTIRCPETNQRGYWQWFLNFEGRFLTL